VGHYNKFAGGSVERIAALCVFSTLWSLGFILLMQLNYVIAPRLTDRF
jgi:hypothetical protein